MAGWSLIILYTAVAACGRIIDFTVAVTAVADHVHDYVASELVAVLHRAMRATRTTASTSSPLTWKIGMSWRRASWRQTRRMQLAGKRGEADQVVDDDVHRTPDAEPGNLRIVQSFGKDALAGERPVAVHQQRQIFSRAVYPGAILLGAGAPRWLRDRPLPDDWGSKPGEYQCARRRE